MFCRRHRHCRHHVLCYFNQKKKVQMRASSKVSWKKIERIRCVSKEKFMNRKMEPFIVCVYVYE